MAASSFLNRVKMSVSGTPGTGTVTLGSAITGFASMADAGAVNATKYTYVIEDGDDFEIGQGTYTSSGATFSRDTVYLSKISGVAGTTKLTLTSNATVAITIAKEDLSTLGPKPADQQVFTASGTWTKPSGFGAKAYAFIQCWGAGGGGGRNTASNTYGGGGGGGYKEFWILLSSLGSTETVTIGAGGLGKTGSAGAGGDGGNTTFGSKVTAYGGAGGVGGASTVAFGATDFAAGVRATTPTSGDAPSIWAGGAGAISTLAAGRAVWGGGGGGGNTNTAGGASQFGSSGASAVAGVPTKAAFSGGGAASSTTNTNGGDGGDGQCIVTVFDGA